MQGLLQTVAYLFGQALLDLKPARICLDHPRDLAQPRDLALRDVGDVAFPEEGQHVMLAKRVQLDVPHQHHLRIWLLEDRRTHDFDAVLRISLRQELQGLGHPLRGLHKSLPVRVLPDQPQYRTHMPGNLSGHILVILLNFPISHFLFLISFFLFLISRFCDASRGADSAVSHSGQGLAPAMV